MADPTTVILAFVGAAVWGVLVVVLAHRLTTRFKECTARVDRDIAALRRFVAQPDERWTTSSAVGAADEPG